MNNPRLVKLKRDYPEKFQDEEYRALRIGSALDCLLTSPDRWDKDFIICNVNRPTGLLGKFVEKLPAGLTIGSPSEDFYTAYIQSGYKMSLAQVIRGFWEKEDVVEFYNLSKNVPKKVTVLAKDEYEAIVKAKELILANEYTYPYFFNTHIHCELIHQVPIYFDYRGTPCKSLLDGIRVDHRERVIQPFDLKTTGKSVYAFRDSFLLWGYYRQCAFYDYAVKTPQSPVYDLIQEGYKVADFVFIVVETSPSSTHPAVIYRTNEKDRIAGFNGGTINNIRYRGIDELIDSYNWHVENNYWELPMELVHSKGEILLDMFV